jgi:hypothetical protein
MATSAIKSQRQMLQLPGDAMISCTQTKQKNANIQTEENNHTAIVWLMYRAQNRVKWFAKAKRCSYYL